MAQSGEKFQLTIDSEDRLDRTIYNPIKVNLTQAMIPGKYSARLLFARIPYVYYFIQNGYNSFLPIEVHGVVYMVEAQSNSPTDGFEYLKELINSYPHGETFNIVYVPDTNQVTITCTTPDYKIRADLKPDESFWPYLGFIENKIYTPAFDYPPLLPNATPSDGMVIVTQGRTLFIDIEEMSSSVVKSAGRFGSASSANYVVTMKPEDRTSKWSDALFTSQQYYAQEPISDFRGGPTMTVTLLHSNGKIVEMKGNWVIGLELRKI